MGSASPIQVVIIILLLCFLCFGFGWSVRDMKGCKIRRFKVKKRLKKLPVRYDWKGEVY